MLAFIGRLDEARAELAALSADTPLQAWRLAYTDAFLGELAERPHDTAALSLALAQLEPGPDRRFARAQMGFMEATTRFRDGGDWQGALAATAAEVTPNPPSGRLLWLWSWRFYALALFVVVLGLALVAGLGDF